MEGEDDTGSKVPEKLVLSWYINDTNVTAEIKYALIQNRAPPVGFKFPPKEYKDKRRSSGLSKDTANTAGSQTLTLYYTLPVKISCTVQYVHCYIQKPRENNQVCLFTSHTPIGKNFKSYLQNHSWTESHRMSKQKWMHLSPHTCSHHQNFIQSLYNWKRNCGKGQKIPYP